ERSSGECCPSIPIYAHATHGSAGEGQRCDHIQFRSSIIRSRRSRNSWRIRKNNEDFPLFGFFSFPVHCHICTADCRSELRCKGRASGLREERAESFV